MRTRPHCNKCSSVMKRDSDMWRCTNKKCKHTTAWRHVDPYNAAR